MGGHTLTAVLIAGIAAATNVVQVGCRALNFSDEQVASGMVTGFVA